MVERLKRTSESLESFQEEAVNSILTNLKLLIQAPAEISLVLKIYKNGLEVGRKAFERYFERSTNPKLEALPSTSALRLLLIGDRLASKPIDPLAMLKAFEWLSNFLEDHLNDEALRVLYASTLMGKGTALSNLSHLNEAIKL